MKVMNILLTIGLVGLVSLVSLVSLALGKEAFCSQLSALRTLNLKLET